MSTRPDDRPSAKDGDRYFSAPRLLTIACGLLIIVGSVKVMTIITSRHNGQATQAGEVRSAGQAGELSAKQTAVPSSGKEGDGTSVSGANTSPDAMRNVQFAIAQGNEAAALRSAFAGVGHAQLNEPHGGMTALMCAASLGQPVIVKMLLDNDADPNQHGASQRTALQYAAEKNQLEIAKLLLDAGADLDAYDNSKLTPLTMAADRNYTDLALLLIGKGADVNLAHAQGWTPLIDAAKHGNVMLAHVLLEHGANRDAKLATGWTAHGLAKNNGHLDVARMLTE
ncbi:MAG: hypothetical protein ACI8PT_001947 [Gammaproteobacteria bacterium]|jgi:hypothetical protein